MNVNMCWRTEVLLRTVSQYLHPKPQVMPGQGSEAHNKKVSKINNTACIIRLLRTSSLLPVKTGQKCDQPALGRGPAVHVHSH